MKRLILSLAACAVLSPMAHAADAGGKAANNGEAPAAKPVKLGTVKFDGVSIVVSRLGDEVLGKDLALQLALPTDAAAPKAIHVWISNAPEAKAVLAKEKVEAKAGDKGLWTATVKLPAKLENGTQLWITEDTAAGKSATRSIPLKG